MKEIYEHHVTAWVEKDAIGSPSPTQAALASEGRQRAELLIRSGWPSLSAYIGAMERDIASGHRLAPAPPATAKTPPTAKASASGKPAPRSSGLNSFVGAYEPGETMFSSMLSDIGAMSDAEFNRMLDSFFGSARRP